MVAGFPCTGCGACCATVGQVLVAFAQRPERYGLVEREALAAFPYQARADGSCEQFEGGRCRVYEDRPLVCRVDAMGAARGWDAARTWRVAAAGCARLQDEAGVPQDSPLRVVVPDRPALLPLLPPHAAPVMDA